MKIDFVVTWVDGNDPAWREEFNRYKGIEGDSRVSRYRDWDNMQYLFRAFEQFTPWVNKIYFVTYGHLPKWLNVNHPKLVIVKHEDFLKKENLPVFNINPIEINFHRIEGLSEHFVYFNDDTFITQPIAPERFFRDGLPVNTAILNIGYEGEIAHIVSNNIAVINKHFQKKKSVLKNFWKWFYPGYGFHMLRSACLMPWSTFSGFYGYHHPQPFLKSTYLEIWEKEPELLEKVSASKIRSSQDVNQYLFRYWQFVKGNFYPASFSASYKKSKYIEMYSFGDVQEASIDIASGKFELYCPNDALDNIDQETFEESVRLLKSAFDKILPNKSHYEVNYNKE